MLDSQKSPLDMRVAFVDALIQCARENPNIWLLIGDVGFGLVEPFQAEFPDRFINVGVAEQNMVGVATGLALSGKTVFCYTFASFAVTRCLEQIRNDVCYHNVDVKIVGGGGGLIYGSLGMSHHATEDIAIMRALPNMTVIAPCDTVQTKLATKAIAESGKPCYLMLSKAGDSITYNKMPEFKIGEAVKFRDGKDVALMATGGIASEALDAAELLTKDGIDCRVLGFHTVKPIDYVEIAYSILNTKMIVTIEEHNLDGGFGSAVAEGIMDLGLPTKLVRIGIENRFCTEVGSQQYLRESNGLTAKHITNIVKEAIDDQKR